ncbi:hypothetical protein [Chroococcidiopsis sp.]|uniref:hypothetical protein n=1 Tax=Chroococcidiopsis sp. TaxID=3088168 RepID=UPI003F2F5123
MRDIEAGVVGAGLLEDPGVQQTVSRLNPSVQESEVVRHVFLRKKGVKQHDITEKEKFHAIACSPAYVSQDLLFLSDDRPNNLFATPASHYQ